MIPMTKQAYRLLHEGSLALAEIENNGMRIDVPRLDRTIEQAAVQIRKLEGRLKEDELWKLWKRRFGDRASLGSLHQLSQILYDELGHEPKSYTSGGRGSKEEKKRKRRPTMNEEALSRINLPFIKTYLRMGKIKDLRSTNLLGVRREVGGDGLLHPVFNLHLARTYRSSSNSPNFQNIPVRDKLLSKLIRRCFVPREGHVLVEVDYGALEVRVAACYNKDPRLIEYICDPTKDMHRDMAAECYLLDEDQVTKETRFYAKNQFVFPEFYGSYWKKVAPKLWDVIDRFGLKTVDGVPLKEHLGGNGIDDYEEFERHIEEVERDFWENRFPDYARWKVDWYKRYQRKGGFRMLTGFRVDGVYRRNDVINYPVQGAAFHCLLWSLVRIVKWIGKEKMRSKVIGQIHDSIVADVHRDELDDYLAKVEEVMTRDIRREWPWIIVPLEIEAEVSETNWYEKEPVAA